MKYVSRHDVWECLINGKDLEEEFLDLPDTLRAWVKQTAFDLWMQFNDAKLHLHSTLDTIHGAVGKDNDEIFNKTVESNPYKDALMLLNRDDDANEIIWKSLEPGKLEF
jgi:hypothetical protein